MHGELRYCDSCKSEHYGKVPCGLTWMERLRSTRTGAGTHDTRTKRRYYDQESLDQQFGGSTAQERKDQMMEETNGVGWVEMGSDGIPVHQNRKTGDIEKVDRREADKLMGIKKGRDSEVDV